MRRGTKVYFVASIVAQAAALLRYVILARMLGPHELGLAASLILTAQFFEAVSETGANRFIVQDSEGDTRTMTGVVQLALALRGILIAVALALTAGFVARMYQAPMLAPALVALGLAPLINGFLHLDVRRLQRGGDFRPEAYSTICGEITSAVVTGIAAWLLRDHMAVVYGLVARALVMVVVSHLSAKRFYGWSFDRPSVARFARFAGPLFLNGFLFFLGSQGDRLIVGSAVGPVGLGYYAAILLLISYPTGSVSRFLTGIHMPQIAGSRDKPDLFARQKNRLGGRTLLVATAMLVGFAIAAPILAPLLYGRQFAQALPMYAILAVLQGMRLLRIWPNIIALGVGDSVTVLMNNIVRMVALPFALAAGFVWSSIYAIVAAFILGEAAALLAALVQLSRKGVVKARPELQRALLFMALGASAIGCSAAAEVRNWALAGLAAVVLVALLLLMAWIERVTIQESLKLLRAGLRRRPRVSE